MIPAASILYTMRVKDTTSYLWETVHRILVLFEFAFIINLMRADVSQVNVLVIISGTVSAQGGGCKRCCDGSDCKCYAVDLRI